MLKISDEGLKDFEEEYKQIMLRKLKYGNAYNKNILAIEHKVIAQLIEKEIDNVLNYPKKLKDLEDKIKNFYQMNGKFKFVEVEKSIRNIFVKIEQIRKNKNRYNTFFKEINKLIDDTNNVKNTKIKHIELENILLCEYNEMEQIISDMETLNNKKRMQELFKEFYTYTKYIDADLRNTILNKIGLNVCPYCGRQFISSYCESGKIRNSAELDHFFSKGKYPYLALSLYNYVPSCHICNSNKRDIDFNKMKHLYPYIEGFEADAKFDIDHSTLITDIISGKEKAKILIQYPEKNTKINNSINTFNLEPLYQNHSKDVQNIFSMIQIYSHSYLKDIANILYVKDDRVSEIEDKISGIQGIESSEKDELKDRVNKLCETDKAMKMAMKAEDLMLLLFKEKDNDEILSKFYNDLLDKYWRMI